MAHAISIDSQIKPLRNTDRAGDYQARAVGRQVAHDAIDYRRIVVEDDFCSVQSPLTRTSAAFVENLAHAWLMTSTRAVGSLVIASREKL
jgi:hypothetical protein